jgi:hypothetical protein
MSFGVALSNAVSVGLGGIVSLFSGTRSSVVSISSLLTESSDNLVQEDGGLILLE